MMVVINDGVRFSSTPIVYLNTNQKGLSYACIKYIQVKEFLEG